MEQDKDSEMKKHILDSIIQNANKLMGDKLKGKPAAMVVDIKAAHPMDPEDMTSSPDMDSDEPSDSKDKLLQMLHPEMAHADMDEEDSESPQDEMLEALHPEMEDKEDSMSEDDNEPSDELKKLIELHLMKKGKI